MSENLKRAESLFNRIMNPNATTTTEKSNTNSHTHSHSHKYRKSNNSSNNHDISPTQIDLPKKDPVKLSQDLLLTIPQDHHILPYCWTIWHHSRSRLKKEHPEDLHNPSVDSYLQTTSEIDFLSMNEQLDATSLTNSIGSVEQLWLSLSSIKKSFELPISTELLIFKTGINPVWEDPINTKGGRWVFRFNRRVTGNEDYDSVQKIRKRISLIWERLIMKTMTGSLIPDNYSPEYQDLLLNDISGLVLSVRKDEDIISIWNSNLNFTKNKSKEKEKESLDGKKLTNFQARRIICDSILRVIRECDLIIQGSDCIDTIDSGSNERVFGVSFEYRLHADNTNPDQSTTKYHRRYKNLKEDELQF